MADGYRIIGAEMSPYSVKVRSYFRYKAIPHQWVLRNAASQAEFEKHAKMPIIPLVVTPDGTGIQDSTPIIDQIEKLHPEPSIHPDDPVARFISALIEEFGDEWGNKWMFHYRWARDVDQICSAGRIARMRAPDGRAKQKHAAFAAQVRARMVDRVWFVGSNADDRAADRGRLSGDARLCSTRISRRGPICSAARPAYGDFGLWGQFYEMWTDPTAGALIERRRAACAGLGAPHAVAEGRRRVRNLGGAGADPDADPDQTGRAAVLAVDAGQRESARRRRRRNSASRSATRSGPRSRKNITRARSACCAPNMPTSPTRRDLDLVLAAAGCLAGIARLDTSPGQPGARPWKHRNTRPP